MAKKPKAAVVLIRAGHRFLDGSKPLVEVFRDASAEGAEVYTATLESLDVVFKRVTKEDPSLVFVNVSVGGGIHHMVSVAQIERVENTGCDDNVVHLKAPIARIDREAPDSSTQLYTRATAEQLQDVSIRAYEQAEIPERRWPSFIKA